MGHDHHHGHHHGHHDAVDRALGWAFVLNGGFLVLEAAAGWWTGSLALLSDAVHMIGDVAALALAYMMRRLSRSAATASRTYGLVGAETLGAFVNALALMGACIFLVVEAVGRLNAPPQAVEAWPVILVGTVGLMINLGSAWKLFQSDRENLNVRGALLHMLADALGSVGAVIAGIFLSYGVPIADPLIALLIAGIVATSSWRLLLETGGILLQFTPVTQPADEVLQALRSLDGIENVHDLHLWSLDGRETILSVHLRIPDGSDADQIRRSVQAMLTGQFGITQMTVQTEFDDGCSSVEQVWSMERKSG